VARKLTLLAGAILAACGVWLAASPSPIDPVGNRLLAAPPLEGPLAPNERLLHAEKLAWGKVLGPEDVAVDGSGRIYAGTLDGRIVRLTVPARGPEVVESFASTGGRPLGVAFDAAGHLLVADARRGLLAVDPTGEVRVLATAASGLPFRFTDDLDVARDGTVYFSDASSRFGYGEHLYDLLEGRPHGRLLAYEPASGKVRVLLGNLSFANGVALSAREDFVLVAETYRYRITRYWLQGPSAGTADVFADNLPGFPDGVDSDRRGTFWVALFTVRNPAADLLQPRPWAKSLLAKLPRTLWPRPKPYGLVLALDEEGRIRESLHDPTGRWLPTVTSAQPEGEFLYLGTLDNPWLARHRLAGGTGP
jgi:sugar lactone lactonase YvrE